MSRNLQINIFIDSQHFIHNKHLYMHVVGFIMYVCMSKLVNGI